MVRGADGSFVRNAGLVMRGVFLEYLRRREFAVTLLFMGVFLLAAALVWTIGVENDATAAFILNFGISIAFLFGAAVSLLTGVRQFPGERDTRRIYPMLAKPLTRSCYLWGKWLAAWLVGATTYILLLVMVSMPPLRPAGLDAGLFIQMMLLHIVSLALVAALSIWMSLVLPVMMSAVILVLMVLGGGKAVQLINAYAPEGLRPVTEWITSYVPNFSHLDIGTQYTDGLGAMPAGDFMLRIVYVFVMLLFLQATASWILEKKSL